MRILYPLNPLNKKEADEPYQEEFLLMSSNGIKCSLFDFDILGVDVFKPKPMILEGEVVLYRGWMLNPKDYKELVDCIESKGAVPFTSYINYIKCHHLPNWYETCSRYTSETKFFPYDGNLKSNIQNLSWDGYFVKDFVKSNSTERGSIATSPEEVVEITGLIHKYRGEVEGGVVVRRVEMYDNNTETRYFVFNGKSYSPNGDVPEIVLNIAERIDAPFFSVDIIRRDDGILRLVEVGDGQVSDKKTWSNSVFIEMMLENII